ncbi:hypothetical protein [Parvibaculum sp.]|uniref:hypothetical protein n=1 Tax=Parvibaculum sp. TaxID=2024848 RepID=UPI00329A1D53
MSFAMKNADLWREAEAYAKQIAPLPKHDPIEAGLMGFFGSGAILFLFVSISGLSSDRFDVPLFTTMAICGIAPYFYFRGQVTKHYRVLGDEYRSLADRYGEVEDVQ